MNLLSQVVPGLRDFRTPAVVGGLWVVAAFLAYLMLPQDQMNAVTDLLNKFGSPADYLRAYQVAFIASGIYIFGVAAIALTRIVAAPLRLLDGLGSYLPVIFLIGPVLIVLELLWPPFIAVLTIIILLCIIALGVVVTATSRGDWRRKVRIFLSEVGNGMLQTISFLTGMIPSTFSSYRRELALLAAESNIKWYENDPAVLERQLTLWSDRTLAKAYLELCGLSESLKQQLDEDDAAYYDREHPQVVDRQAEGGRGVETLFGNSPRLRLELALQPEMPGAEALRTQLRREIITKFRSSPEERRRNFVISYALTEIDFVSAEERFKRAQVHVKDRQPTIYDEYDRRRAEAEFRSSVALPLGCVVALVAVLVQQSMSVEDLNVWWFVAIGAIPLLLFLWEGRRKRLDASQWIFAAVRSEIANEGREATSIAQLGGGPPKDQK